MSKSIVVFACLSMALAVTLGALGAHALKEILSSSSLESLQTGVRYQIVHSLSILILVLLGRMTAVPFRTAIRMMAIGMILFSFSIYLLSTREITGLEHIGPYIGWVTPVGGILLITSWLWVAIGFSKQKKTT